MASLLSTGFVSSTYVLKFSRKRTSLKTSFAVKSEENGAVSTKPRPKAKEVKLVDPLVAKRMAEEDMQARIRRSKFQNQQKAEAINGGLAVIGLTAALIGEGLTGQGAIGQISGYIDSIATVLEKVVS